MRRVYVFIATTGLELDARVIEISAIEELDGILSVVCFNQLINPDGTHMHDAAFAVTGYDDDFLKQYPLFSEIAEAFLCFIEGAELICWDVNYDLAYLNRELRLLGKPSIKFRKNCAIAPDVRVTVKKMFPKMTCLRDRLYKYFDVNGDDCSLSWTQSSCLYMARLYPKIKNPSFKQYWRVQFISWASYLRLRIYDLAKL